MHYIDIIQSAPSKSEDLMWQAVRHTSQFIDQLWRTHQPIANRFIMEQFELIHGPHFNEQLARATVADMYHDNTHGEIITPDEASSIAPSPEQNWDAYVAANAFAHDLAPMGMSRKDLLHAAETFWFHDQDFPSDSKIFWYFKNK